MEYSDAMPKSLTTTASAASRCMKRRKQRRKSDLKGPPAVVGYTILYIFFSSAVFYIFRCVFVDNFLWRLESLDFGVAVRCVYWQWRESPPFILQRSKCKSVFLPFETEAEAARLSSLLPLSNVVRFELFTISAATDIPVSAVSLLTPHCCLLVMEAAFDIAWNRNIEIL